MDPIPKADAPSAEATPQTQPPTAEAKQPELDLKPSGLAPTPPTPEPAPTPEPVAPAALVTPPEPEAKPKAKPAAKKAAFDPAELEKIAGDYAELKQSHDALQAAIVSAQGDRRLQVIRAAGVEALSSEEIMKLAPTVDPDTTEGRAQINAWIDAHPGLVAPRLRMQTTPAKEIAATAIENPAVKSLFGDAETVRSRIKTLMGGD